MGEPAVASEGAASIPARRDELGWRGRAPNLDGTGVTRLCAPSLDRPGSRHLLLGRQSRVYGGMPRRSGNEKGCHSDGTRGWILEHHCGSNGFHWTVRASTHARRISLNRHRRVGNGRHCAARLCRHMAGRDNGRHSQPSLFASLLTDCSPRSATALRRRTPVRLGCAGRPCEEA